MFRARLCGVAGAARPAPSASPAPRSSPVSAAAAASDALGRGHADVGHDPRLAEGMRAHDDVALLVVEPERLAGPASAPSARTRAWTPRAPRARRRPRGGRASRRRTAAARRPASTTAHRHPGSTTCWRVCCFSWYSESSSWRRRALKRLRSTRARRLRDGGVQEQELLAVAHHQRRVRLLDLRLGQAGERLDRADVVAFGRARPSSSARSVRRRRSAAGAAGAEGPRRRRTVSRPRARRRPRPG